MNGFRNIIFCKNKVCGYSYNNLWKIVVRIDTAIKKNNSACWSRTKLTIIIIISLRFNLFSPWDNWKMTRLVLNNNNSLTSFTLKWFVICHMHVHVISLRREVGSDKAEQRNSSQRSLKCDLVSGNLSDSSPSGYWNFIVQIQLLGFTIFLLGYYNCCFKEPSWQLQQKWQVLACRFGLIKLV